MASNGLTTVFSALDGASCCIHNMLRFFFVNVNGAPVFFTNCRCAKGFFTPIDFLVSSENIYMASKAVPGTYIHANLI